MREPAGCFGAFPTACDGMMAGVGTFVRPKAKLQKAGYNQAAEKWDSDSDSDESDEEDLKM